MSTVVYFERTKTMTLKGRKMMKSLLILTGNVSHYLINKAGQLSPKESCKEVAEIPEAVVLSFSKI